MTTKFLGTTSESGNPTDGTLDILGNTLSATNLLASMPVKTNGSRNLVSSKLEISDVNNLETKVETYDTKTFYIDNTLSIGSTKFNSSVYANQFIINEGPNPPQYLMTDGTATSINDNSFIMVQSAPYNTFSNIIDSLGDVFYDRNSSSLYGFQPPFKNEPLERTPRAYNGTVYEVKDEIEFDSAIIEPPDGAVIRLTANINFTTPKIVSKSGLKFTSDNGQRVITYSTANAIIDFTGDSTLVDGLKFYNDNSSSSASCLSFSSTTASSNHVQNCVFFTNEYAITSVNNQIQIRDNTFYYVGFGDDHRYITLYKNTGSTIIARNTFQGNSSQNTSCIAISNSGSSSYTSGKFVIKNNTTYAVSNVQCLTLCDATFNINDNLEFWIHDNNITSANGFVVFYNVVPMTGVLRLVAYSNTEVLGIGITDSKGIIACESSISTTLPDINSPPYITVFNNTHSDLRVDYTGWMSGTGLISGDVSYNNLVISTIGNTPKLYSAVLQDVITGSVSEKTSYINLPLEPNGTRFLNNVYADKFIIQGGPNPAGYLMSDGTILVSSSNNINSNIYLYNNNLTTSAPPSNGQIRFNNSVNQNASIVWISHLTRDSIDVDSFLSLISQLSILYIQDQDNSQNYIRYNVNSAPTLIENSYVTVPVTFLDGNGTGLTQFPNGMNIFLSIFTNDVEIDSRISNLETKTQNINANSSSNTISKSTTVILENAGNFIVRDNALNPLLGVNQAENDIFTTLNMNTNRITGVSNPSANSDAVNKLYVDNADNLKLNLSGGTMSGALNMGTNNITNAGQISGADLTVINNATALGFRTPTGLDTDFLKANGTIDSNYYMPADSNYSATCVPYININGLLTSSLSNRYCQAGDNLQTFVDTITSGLDQDIQLSAGVHTVSNLTLTKIAYSISGVQCPPLQPTTTINGTVTIGSAVNTRLIKFSHILFNNTLTFFSSATGQQTQHSFYNCQFGNTITFPNAVLGTSGYLYFTDCYISTANAITFNNIVCSIVFTRCRFNNNVITNNSPVGSVIFDSCSGLNSLTVTNAVYRGVNVLNNGNSSLGSTTKYCNIQAIGLSPVTNTGITEVILNQVASIGSYSYFDSIVGTIREWVILGTHSRSSNAGSVYTLRHKTNGVENMLLAMPSVGNTLATTPFELRFRVIRYTSAAIAWEGQWADAERRWGFYTTQNNTGGIPALNVSGAYTITFQASNANTTINVNHIDVNNIYG